MAKAKSSSPNANSSNGSQDSQFDEWALLELFGHQRMAGRVRNASIGGGSFIRVDVPAIGEQEALTRFISPNAVYAITPMSEKTVRTLIKTGLRCEPISRYDVSKMLPAAREEYEEE